MLGRAAEGSGAYFRFDAGIYRLDDRGWTEIWTEPVDRLLLGGDRAAYLADRVGIHRLQSDGLQAVWVIDERTPHPLHTRIDELTIGPAGEIWGLSWGDRHYTINYVEPGKPPLSWGDPEQHGVVGLVAMVLDGSGRAWFLLENPNPGIVHKHPRGDWKRIEAWTKDEHVEVFAWAADPRAHGGLWLMTRDDLLRVGPEGVVERAALPDRGIRRVQDLAINTSGYAVVRDAGCNLDRYVLAELAQPPKHLGDRWHCYDEPMFFMLDERERLWWRTSEQTAAVLLPVGRELTLPSMDGDRGELYDVVVLDRGPELPLDGDATELMR